MAHSENLARDRRRPDHVFSASDVRDEMTAIFGANQRNNFTLPIKRAIPVRRESNRRMTYLAPSFLAVAMMITTGVLAGRGVFSASPATPKILQPHGAMAKPSRPPSTSAAVIKDARQDTFGSADQRIEPTASASASTQFQASVEVVPSSTKLRARPELTVQADGNNVVAAVASIRNVEAVLKKDDGPRTVAPTNARQPSCSTPYECLNSQMQADERDVAVAYQKASIAGVRPATLRGYRNEWRRARELERTSPQEAMRIYGMIEADLRLLAADPTID